MLSNSLLQNHIANQAKALYAVDLSKNVSVTPQRHCGFIVPNFCIDPQFMHESSTSIPAMQTRLNSLYEGMTRQNKSAMANMSGGTYVPRVNPLTSLFTGENFKTQKRKEAAMPNLSHSTSKLLAEVYNVNSDYIERLADLKNLANIAISEAKTIKALFPNMDFKPLFATYKAVSELSFLWCDYLEENQNIIREAKTERPLGMFLCSIEDDFCEYLERAETLKSLITLAQKEIDSLDITSLEIRIHSQHLNSLTSVMYRSFCTLCADIEEEQDVLSEIHPQAEKEGA